MILSAAAGVDHILPDPHLPLHVPIVRMVREETAERISDFVVMAALGLVRQLPDLIAAQRSCNWEPHLIGRLASQTIVGIMGLAPLSGPSDRPLKSNLTAAPFRNWWNTARIA